MNRIEMTNSKDIIRHRFELGLTRGQVAVGVSTGTVLIFVET